MRFYKAHDPDSDGPYWHGRGYLPHFETSDHIQSLTFRLADSLPKNVVERLLVGDKAETDAAYRTRLENFLDRGYGSCILRDPVYAERLEQSFLHCDGSRYDLHAWVIMPNHVHMLLQMRKGFKLGKEMKAWKASISRLVAKRTGKGGQVWEEDGWDRFIRDEEHYHNVVAYIDNNPVKAGLVREVREWPWGSCRFK